MTFRSDIIYNNIYIITFCWSCLMQSFFVCAELRKAGNGERNGQTHDQRRAAGHQVRPTLISSSLFPIFFFIGHLVHFIFLLYLVSSFFFMVLLFAFIRSQDISADRTELTLPASIEFRDNCKCQYFSFCLSLFSQWFWGVGWTNETKACPWWKHRIEAYSIFRSHLRFKRWCICKICLKHLGGGRERIPQALNFWFGTKSVHNNYPHVHITTNKINPLTMIELDTITQKIVVVFFC